ncbi:hypothetical protein C7437_101210 [Psychrobacillus insolitus]|uniref:Phosphotransferase family enzyme n=1 Tax=Psychrobacillus insolitus TaxID=1461 RepID=A0A2W7N581_9BACI|nr:hypothetical protein [Psychrobacillus insolitus]PZX07103.1 hypothetical protein C7437_101210 [Psychrobacillus insolitus]
MPNSVKQIKKNVWKWENENGIFSVKKYETVEQAKKIRIIHEQLANAHIHFVLPIIESSQPDFVIQPWFKGTHAVDYHNKLDRKETYLLLNYLHDTMHDIDWQQQKILKPFNLENKWQNRLFKMNEISYFIEHYLGITKTKKLLQYGEIALKNMSRINDHKSTLLHGDVVHHNFLSNEFSYKMIDFDLAVLGPKEVEDILWIDRVLPSINYDLFLLIQEFPDLEKVVRNHKEAFIYPNELYREWLYAYSLPIERKQKFIDKLVPYTNKALTNWPNLCYNLSHL